MLLRALLGAVIALGLWPALAGTAAAQPVQPTTSSPPATTAPPVTTAPPTTATPPTTAVPPTTARPPATSSRPATTRPATTAARPQVRGEASSSLPPAPAAPGGPAGRRLDHRRPDAPAGPGGPGPRGGRPARRGGQARPGPAAMGWSCGLPGGPGRPGALPAQLVPGTSRRDHHRPRRDSSIWRRVADWLVSVRYLDYLPAQGRAGRVACLSGRTAAYRRSLLLPLLPGPEREIFLGRECVAGIGPQFLEAGAGYGGSCFPKDVAAFAHRSAELGVDFGILRETARVNLAARQRVLDKVRDALWHLAGKRVGVLGLAFKPETDDLREAPAMDVVRGLLAEGAEVVAYDPVAGDQAVDLLPEMKLAPEPLDAVEGAHALVVMTGWPELAELDPVVARERMAYPILVDARNALDAEAFGRAGFTVIGVGRPVRNALTPAWR